MSLLYLQEHKILFTISTKEVTFRKLLQFNRLHLPMFLIRTTTRQLLHIVVVMRFPYRHFQGMLRRPGDFHHCISRRAWRAWWVLLIGRGKVFGEMFLGMLPLMGLSSHDDEHGQEHGENHDGDCHSDGGLCS